MLPEYLAKASPNPAANRAPWFKNTAPSYAGIFLWIAFYNAIAVGTLNHGSVALSLAALAAAGLLSYALFYLVPATLGMQTGHPLYVLGSSTFGTLGGYLMPGLLMGVLQIGWFAVATFFSAKFVCTGLGLDAATGSVPFTIAAVIWGLVMGYVGAKGIGYVAKVATYLNFIPLLMLVIVFVKMSGGIASYTPPEPAPFITFTMLIQIVVGFFATAGAAGADFGTASRDARDVRLGGLVGVALAVLIAGGLPLLSVAGAKVLMPGVASYQYDAVVGAIGGTLATAMFFLFTIASIPPTCFCAFIAGNSFATMIPGVPRIGSTMAGVAVAIVLAVTGVAENLIGFFTIVGASFGPICGAMAADYILAGRRWAGPRQGVNIAGYGAWAIGFLVGLLPFLPVSAELKQVAQPAAVYSFLAGFAAYWLLAKAGLQGKLASEFKG